MFHRIWNNRYLKGVFRRIANRERNAVDRYATFVNREIAASHHFLTRFIFEGEVGAAIRIRHIRTNGGTIHMPLHDVSV